MKFHHGFRDDLDFLESRDVTLSWPIVQNSLILQNDVVKYQILMKKQRADRVHRTEANSLKLTKSKQERPHIFAFVIAKKGQSQVSLKATERKCIRLRKPRLNQRMTDSKHAKQNGELPPGQSNDSVRKQKHDSLL